MTLHVLRHMSQPAANRFEKCGNLFGKQLESKVHQTAAVVVVVVLFNAEGRTVDKI
jgi:hypothetical protein